MNLRIKCSLFVLLLLLRLPSFIGKDANCKGVFEGWMGFRKDTSELQYCVSEMVVKKKIKDDHWIAVDNNRVVVAMED